MDLNIKFCSKHCKMLTDKRPVCPMCLIESNFDIIQKDDEIYINSKNLKKLLNSYLDKNDIEIELYRAIELLNKIITYAKKMEKCLPKDFKLLDNEHDKELMASSISEVGKHINEIIISEFERKDDESFNDCDN